MNMKKRTTDQDRIELAAARMFELLEDSEGEDSVHVPFEALAEETDSNEAFGRWVAVEAIRVLSTFTEKHPGNWSVVHDQGIQCFIGTSRHYADKVRERAPLLRAQADAARARRQTRTLSCHL